MFQEADECTLLVIDAPLAHRQSAHVLVGSRTARDARRVSHRRDINERGPHHLAHLNWSIVFPALFIWPINRIYAVVHPLVRKVLCAGRFVQVDAVQHGTHCGHSTSRAGQCRDGRGGRIGT